MLFLLLLTQAPILASTGSTTLAWLRTASAATALLRVRAMLWRVCVQHRVEHFVVEILVKAVGFQAPFAEFIALAAADVAVQLLQHRSFIFFSGIFFRAAMRSTMLALVIRRRKLALQMSTAHVTTYPRNNLDQCQPFTTVCHACHKTISRHTSSFRDDRERSRERGTTWVSRVGDVSVGKNEEKEKPYKQR